MPSPAPISISVRSYARLVRSNPNFRRLWIAQAISEMGDWFYSLAIYNLLLELTGRAEAVALAVILQVLPQTLIGPTSGVINDRLSRRKVMIAADLARVGIVLCMLFARTPSTVWIVYPLLFLESLMASLFEPARAAVIPNVVQPEETTIANTLSATTWSFDLAIGAMFGGIVAAWLGRDAVFILNALSFLGSAWLIWRMKFNEPHLNAAPFHARELVSLAPVMDGIRYMTRDRRIFASVFLKSGVGILGSSFVLLPVMGERLFPLRSVAADPHRASVLAMSVLMGARGFGALLGPLFSAQWGGINLKRLRRGSLLGYCMYGTGYLIVSQATNITVACLGIMFAHAGGSMIWVFSTTLLQMITEDNFRGRVFAAEYGFLTLAIAIATFLVGFALDHGLHPQRVAMLTGLAALVPVTLWSLALAGWRDEKGVSASK
ncbi:MAG: MFS transporter [Terriglobales bacterium]